MSTPATITIQIRDCDLGRFKKCDPTKLPLRTKKDIEKRASMLYPKEDMKKDREEYIDCQINFCGGIPSLEKMQNLCKRVKLKRYITIYHHWDGGIYNLGEELRENYSDYNKALNLLLTGDFSTIMEGAMPYIGLGKTTWKSQKPYCSDTLPDCEQNYQYLFCDGAWYVRTHNDIKFKSL